MERWQNGQPLHLWIENEHDSLLVHFPERFGPPGDSWRQRLHVEWVACPVGGARPLFRCPSECGRRAMVLYLDGALFACRSCCNLNYPSQRHRPFALARHRVDALRAELGWRPGEIHGIGPMPASFSGRKRLAVLLKYEEALRALADEYARVFPFLCATGRSAQSVGSNPELNDEPESEEDRKRSEIELQEASRSLESLLRCREQSA